MRPDALGALAFLVTRSIRNRFARQLAKIKNPRYAIAMVFGIAYFWFFLFRPIGSSQRRRILANNLPPGAPPEAVAAATAATAGVSQALALFLSLSMSVTLILWWLVGGVSGALAFQPAEVQFLFSAPLTRRQVLAYKLVRTQVIILFNALIWMFLMQRWGLTMNAGMRFVTAWAFFSLIATHRLAAALVQAPNPTATRRALQLLGKGLAVAASAALLYSAVPAIIRMRQLEFDVGIEGLRAAFNAAPAVWVLAPLRLMLAPISAVTTAQWASAVGVIVAAVLAHVLWIFGMRVEYEEAAAEVSASYAKRIAAWRERRAGGAMVIKPTKPKKTWIPLKPTGLPEVALLWKNTLAMQRTGGVRGLIVIGVLLAVITRTIAMASANSKAPAAALIPLAIIAAVTLVFGPRSMRNDLRQDLPSLALLKTYPMTGARVVAAQLASPVIVLTLGQLGLIILGYLAMPPSAIAKLLTPLVVSLLLVAPVVFAALNSLGVVIQNAAALMFPAWVRLGTDSGGVEVIGQNLVFTIGSSLTLLVTLIPAAIVAGIGYAVVSIATSTFAPAAAALLGAAVILLEVWAAVGWLGRVFERTEPTALS